VSRSLVSLAVLAFAVCGLLPIAFMLTQVGVADLAGVFGERTLGLLGRTLAYGLVSTALALTLGVPFGFLVARTDLPLAAWLRPLGVVPLLLPPMMVAMVWTEMTDVKGGPAAVFVSGVCTFPLVALFTARAFERIDGRMEEAALLAGGLSAAVRSSVRPVLPAALCGACIAFVFTVNDFSVPDYVSWVGVEKFSVYADEVFASWRIDQRPGGAVASAFPLIALTLASLLPALALRRRGSLATLSGGFRRPEALRLGKWRWPAFAFAGGLVLLAALVPIARLAWEAGGGPRPDGWSLAGWRGATARGLELARGDLQNSIVYALAAATLCAPLGLILGHALERSRRGRLLEPLALLPIAVPAILFGIGMIVVWNHDLTARFYDGGGLVVLLLVGRFVAFPILLMAGAVTMLDVSLEDAARVSGAGPARRLGSIVAPSLRSSLVGGWILVFVFALRELDCTILVPAANHTAMFRIYNAVHFGRDDFVAALSLLLIFLILLPGLLWSLFARRRLEVLP
jgi:iron(III) transport system permease protein